MKVAITGHTQGIGLALKSVYEQHGHHVLGFSRSNGYDITNSEDRKKIIQQIQDYDLFLNNAHDYDQTFCGTYMLTELWETWKDQKKTIANISSSVTMRWEKGQNCALTYRIAKRTMEDC